MCDRAGALRSGGGMPMANGQDKVDLIRPSSLKRLLGIVINLFTVNNIVATCFETSGLIDLYKSGV